MKNNSKFVSLVIILFLVIFSSSLTAQENLFATKGVIEIGGSISYSNYTSVSGGETGSSLSIFGITPQIGYFVTDGFEIGLGTGISLLPSISVISPENGESTSFIQLFFSPSYNFTTEGKKIYPFIEAQLGYTSVSSNNSTADGFSYGGKAGIKVAAVEHLLISFAVQYLAITINPSESSERNGLNYLLVGVGISGYF